MVVLLSTPRGIEMDYLATPLCCPEPRQGPQNYFIIFPWPAQLSQFVLITIMPCCTVLNPVPLHLLHTIGLVPGFDPVPLQLPQLSTLLN